MRTPAGTLATLFLSLAALFLLVACPTEEQQETVLDIPIDKNNDSLLTFDTLIIKVYSKDSSFVQEVFHGKLTDPKKLIGLPLDPRVGKEFTVSIVGYKGGKLGLHREVKVLDLLPSDIRDLPVKDTIIIAPLIPEILAPTDTFVSEGKSLRFRIDIRNPWDGATLGLEGAPTGAQLDTAGTASRYAYFSFTPTHAQGRAEPYAVTFVHASGTQRVEKVLRLRVHDINRPPKFSAIADQKAKENEALSFKVEAADPDGDSLTITATGLPSGAEFKAGVFSWTPQVGQSGNYSIKLKAFDGKDSDFVAVLVTVGNVDPPPPLTFEIVSPASDTTVNMTPITVRYNVNGTLLQKDEALKEGLNRIYLDTTVLGRTAFDTLHVTLDTTPPGMPRVKGPVAVNTQRPTWTWASGGGGNGTYRYRLGGEDMTGATLLRDTLHTVPEDLDPGAHTLFVQERDEVGNWSPIGKHTIRIDTARPAPPEVSGPPSSSTNDPRPVWSWKGIGDDLSGVFRYKLDSKDFTDAIETRELSFQPAPGKPLSEGTHTLYVQQRDEAGNWSDPGSASVQIDLTPPEPPIFDTLPKSPLNSLQPEWRWTSGGGGNGTYRYVLEDSTLLAGGTSMKTNSYLAPMALIAGLHVLYVQEADAAGNWSRPSSKALVLSKREAVGTPGFSPGRVNSTSLVLNGSGIPYIAFDDAANSWKATVMRLNSTGTAWENVGNAGFSIEAATSISLALNSQGVPHVAFSDRGDGLKVKVMRLNAAGTAWENVGNTGLSTGTTLYTAMALSSTGVPYVVFSDAAFGYKATVMRLTSGGSAWQYLGGSGFSPGVVENTSLALTSTSVPYVAFKDMANDGKASVMRLNLAGTGWEFVGGAGLSMGEVHSPSLALSSTGVPYIAFQDEARAKKATVMRLNAAGTAWETVGGAGFTPDAAIHTSLTLSNTGVPYVAFKDIANGSKATVMRLNAAGTGWETVGNPGISAGEALFTSLALSGAGVPYVAYSDLVNDYKATVTKTSFDP